jgi:hypothetical protein
VQLIADGLIEAWRATIMYDWSKFSYNYSTEADAHAKRVEQSRREALPLMADDIHLRPELTDGLPGAFVDTLDTVRVFISSQRWLIYLIGFVTLIAMPISFFSRSRHWLALGYCGVTIHGSMLLTAAVTVFIPRYALPVDPVILVAGVIMVDGLLSWGRARLRELEVGKSLTAVLKPIRHMKPRSGAMDET